MHCIYIYFAVVFINIDQDFLSDPYCPYCYEMLSNHFQKSITSIKILFSLNSTTKMHQFQKCYFIWLFKIIYALNIYNLHCLFNILTMSLLFAIYHGKQPGLPGFTMVSYYSLSWLATFYSVYLSENAGTSYK